MAEFSHLLLPRCSTTLDVLIAESSTSSFDSKTSLDSSGSLTGRQNNLHKAIEPLNLAPISPIVSPSLKSPWTTTDDVAIDSDYRSLSSKSSELVFGSSPDEEHLEKFTRSNEQFLHSPIGDTEALSLEPEAEILEQFRRFGVRFIRHPEQYTMCGCEIPDQLLEWLLLISEVAIRYHDPLPVCLHYRWAEVKQDFNVDLFGDLQFQDFFLAREQRGPHHAMIHFAGLFANVGYDGSYWYWVLLGDGEMPFIESRHRSKSNYVDSLRTMVREQFRLHRDRQTICPEPTPNAHLYVRADETEFQREPDNHESVDKLDGDMPDILIEEWINEDGAVGRPVHNTVVDSFNEEDVRIVYGQRAPRELSYLQLYCDRYNNFLASL